MKREEVVIYWWREQMKVEVEVGKGGGNTGDEDWREVDEEQFDLVGLIVVARHYDSERFLGGRKKLDWNWCRCFFSGHTDKPRPNVFDCRHIDKASRIGLELRRLLYPMPTNGNRTERKDEGGLDLNCETKKQCGLPFE
jgi:hypothetical protein